MPNLHDAASRGVPSQTDGRSCVLLHTVLRSIDYTMNDTKYFSYIQYIHTAVEYLHTFKLEMFFSGVSKKGKLLDWFGL